MSTKTVVSKVFNDYNHNGEIKTLKKDIAIIDKDAPLQICDNDTNIRLLKIISKIEFPMHNCEITYELKEVETNTLIKENSAKKQQNKKTIKWFYSFEGFLKQYISELSCYVNDEQIRKILKKISECDSLKENKDMINELERILKIGNLR